jgi:hypothetical protein
MIELVAGRYRDEHGEHANDATHERYHTPTSHGGGGKRDDKPAQFRLVLRRTSAM